MMVVPRFFNYEIPIRKISEKKPLKRPMLSFEISVQGESIPGKEKSNRLYVMEFLNIEAHITEVIDDFMRCFSVDYRKYLNYIKRINLMNV